MMARSSLSWSVSGYTIAMVTNNLEELTEQKFMTAGVTQSAVLQRAKLKIVLDKIDRLLKIAPDDPEKKWSLESKALSIVM